MLFLEPANLAFRVSTRITLHQYYGLIEGMNAIQVSKNMPVSDRQEDTRTSPDSVVDEPPDLGDQPILDHPIDAPIDTFV